MQVSPQQPNILVQQSIDSVLGQRPEWRQRMAVMTSSPILRQTLLNSVPSSGRAAGSAVFGETHIWRPHGTADCTSTERANMNLTYGAREIVTEYSDQNWPKVNPRESCLGHVETKTQCLPFPVEHVKYDLTRTRSKRYSIPKAVRFPPLTYTTTPGPVTYQPLLLPRALSAEDSVVRSNFKGLVAELEHTKSTTSPNWSLSKMRRSCSEAQTGHALRDGGPMKTDSGCCSPGPVYEHFSIFHPNKKRAACTLASHASPKKWLAIRQEIPVQ